MKRGGPSHPKVLRLARRLNIPRAHAVGILEMLWHFAAKYAPQGDVGKFSDEDLAEQVDWRGTAGELVAGLVAEELLDASATHRLIIHDWGAHADDAVHLVVARARKYFADGTAPKRKRLSEEERKQLDLFYEFATPHGTITAPAPSAEDDTTPKGPGETESASSASGPALTSAPSTEAAKVEATTELHAEQNRAHGVRTACALPSHPLPLPPPPSPPVGEERETAAPGRLTEEQRAEVRAWCSIAENGARGALRILTALEAACLKHARSRGTRSFDWAAEVSLWAWRHCDWEREPKVARFGGGRMGRTEGMRLDREKRQRLELEKRAEITRWHSTQRAGPQSLEQLLTDMRAPPERPP